MSRPFNNAASVPECTCKLRTGYIDADTDKIRCHVCDGVISGTESLTMAEIAKYNQTYKDWAFDNLGEDIDHLDIEREVAEVRQDIADELNEEV